MYTVYGIYKAGTNEPLYIGSTQADLKVRFGSHVTAHKVYPDAGEIVRARFDLFRRHREGLITLEIRPIATCGSRKELLRREYAEIWKHRPAFNKVVGVSHNVPKVKRVRPPKIKCIRKVANPFVAMNLDQLYAERMRIATGKPQGAVVKIRKINARIEQLQAA